MKILENPESISVKKVEFNLVERFDPRLDIKVSILKMALFGDSFSVAKAKGRISTGKENELLDRRMGAFREIPANAFSNSAVLTEIRSILENRKVVKVGENKKENNFS